MTELETHLLNALKHLEQQFNEQHRASEQAQNELRTMFEDISQENEDLREQVSNLSAQIEQLAALYNKKNRY